MKISFALSRTATIGILYISLVSSIMAQEQFDSLNVGLHIMPDQHSYILRCTAVNAAQTDTVIPLAAAIMSDNNRFLYRELGDKYRQRWSIGLLVSYPNNDLPDPLIIAGNSTYTEYVDKTSFFDYGARNLIGTYVSLFWSVRKQSNPLSLAFSDHKGNIAPPVVDPRDPTAKPILAFVFNENQTNQVGFLFLNGSNETVNVEKPLTQASRIVATAPAIGYTNELFITGQPSETVAIEAGKVGEWRIPWQTIHDLIPAADLAAIRAAGGDLDLVWKVGNVQSDPLPISLAEPENNAPPE